MRLQLPSSQCSRLVVSISAVCNGTDACIACLSYVMYMHLQCNLTGLHDRLDTAAAHFLNGRLDRERERERERVQTTDEQCVTKVAYQHR